ncbi:prenyltransferase [Thiospirochaeta perfilievii]|uniref:Prenyltransferase n=2 Tax=Thiospirochaeta perfilievii TaxID=252967 RepID=A0A5C1QIN5_9SPIO|nr:prenyltransferase [Thiospirochaeta perfilievii]
MYFIALRPFSLTLAFASTSYGILAAFINDLLFTDRFWHDILLIILITIAGIASQAGANLINDYFEGSFKYKNSSKKTRNFLGRQRTNFDIFVFISGIAALGIAGLIGIYLIYLTDLWMLVIGLIGLIGSYAYTGEPFVYKRRALGVPLSFVLMGLF